MKDLKSFFQKLNINPKNEELYELAFTHASYNSDANTTHHDYEKLEFLGDSVIGFFVATMIYHLRPEMNEGQMTRTRSSLVQSMSLAKYALKLGFDEYIRAGHSLTRKEVSTNHNILEDIFEAVMGAIYLDQGIEFISKLLEEIFKEDIINFELENITDYKSLLQEAMQAEYRESVQYKIIDEVGPPHDKTFTTQVLFNECVLGTGTGKTKKESEQRAAKDALSKKATI